MPAPSDLLPCSLPVVQAPMAGGPSTPQLTAAVTAAGGYGYVAGGYLTASALREVVVSTRERLEGAAFGVNLFVPAPHEDRSAAVAAYARTLADEARAHGVELGDARWEDDDYPAKLDLLVADPVHTVGFTFGCPSAADVARLHDAGSAVAVTVISVAEARAAADAGADLLVVQGTEAGGHQGGFLDLAANERPLLTTLAGVRAVTDLPVLAAGGIVDATGARTALDAGALAVVIGTALLATPEAETSAPYRRALLEQTYDDTVLTRAFSGRWARGLTNRFAREHTADAPGAYPEIHHLTRPVRAAATKAGDADVPNLWAGTGWRGVTDDPAADVVRRVAGA